MTNSTPVSVMLEDKVPVYVVYLTSWVNKDGVLQFRNDIYGYDDLQKDLMSLEQHRRMQDQFLD